MDIFQALIEQARTMQNTARLVAGNAQLVALVAHVEKLRAQHPEIEDKLDELYVGRVRTNLETYLASQYVDTDRELEDIFEDIDHDFLD